MTYCGLIKFQMISCHTSLTFTDNSSILMVATVVLTPAQVEAVSQVQLGASALHIVQQDGT